MSDYIIKDGELYHYGVPGMKWGIRRSREKLSKRIDKLTRSNDTLRDRKITYDKLAAQNEVRSNQVIAKNQKYASRIAKASAKKSKYLAKQYKAQNGLFRSEERAAKYAGKVAKYDMKLNKAKAKLNFNKYATKAANFKALAEEAKTKIESNDRLKTMYTSTIRAMDKGTIKQGKLFMQYVLD